MRHDHGIEELEYITIILLALSDGLKQFAIKHAEDIDFYRIFLRDTNLLIFNLISRRESVDRYMIK